MTPTQVDALSDETVRSEAVDAFDAALLARHRRQAAIEAVAEANVELTAAEQHEQRAQDDMAFWESVLVNRHLTLREALR